MLLRTKTLRGIAAGEIRLAFRRWTRPTVRAGGRLRTHVGELAIEAVDAITLAAISPADARLAGFDSRAALLRELRGRTGTLYRIRLHLAGADTRIALRTRSGLSSAELAAIAGRLASMDSRSRGAPWTRAVLDLIESRPETRAADLAACCGMARAPFKARVRRLKELGLTESMGTGYRLSPRGRRVWRHLAREGGS